MQPSIDLPVGLQNAIMAEDFGVDSCLTTFGLTWEKAKANFARAVKKKAKAQKGIAKAQQKLTQKKAMKTKAKAKIAREAELARTQKAFARAQQKFAKAKEAREEPPSGYFFKYKQQTYQEVSNFCNHHNGLKSGSSSARKVVVNTDFPKSAYLVVPRHSRHNYRWIPADWKNGVTDLSEEPDAAYQLKQEKKPTGAHILLVSSEELKRAAARALLLKRAAAKAIEKTQSLHKRQKATQDFFFLTEQVGICPDCGKAADVSNFTVDMRNRFRCPQPDCKKQKSLLRWHCSKCSSKGKTTRKITCGYAGLSKDYAIQQVTCTQT